MSLSHFDERSGIIACDTPWGRWWQTVSEVYIEVNVPEGTRGKDCIVDIKPKFIDCKVNGKSVFQGEIFRTVVAEECTWTLEERKQILILLVKSDSVKSEKVWESLLVGQYMPNPYLMHEMMKKLDLERFQIQNPGFDFSGAKLNKTYDNIPNIPTEDSGS